MAALHPKADIGLKCPKRSAYDPKRTSRIPICEDQMKATLRRVFDSALTSCGLILLAGCTDSSVGDIASGEIVEIVIPAPSLSGNLLGDPNEQPVSIYLPPSYGSSSDKRYPVLYLLHGFTGTNRTWMIDPDGPDLEPVPGAANGNYQHEGVLQSERLDSIMAAGIVPELIIVAPNGRNTYKHSFYVNSPVTGNWEDYVVEDVVGFIDANFRTMPAAASRGIAGHSGGGNGALYLAMRHPQVFASVYAMSPCCSGASFSLPSLVATETGEPNQFWQDVYTSISSLSSLDQLPMVFTDRPEDFYRNAELAAAAAFAPNPDRPPFYGDYLFELREGHLVRNESAYERRMDHSVYRLIDKHEDTLRSLRGMFIDWGEHEMEPLALGNAEFVEALALQRIPYISEIYAGGYHGNMITERLESRGLKFFAETLQYSEE